MYNEASIDKRRKTFEFDFYPKKDVTAACIAMETLYEDSAHRLFSVRAWDRQGFELWSDDMLSLNEMQNYFPSLAYWMTKARFGEVQEFLAHTFKFEGYGITADFYFRRVQ